MLFEQPVHFGDHPRVDLAQLGGVEWQRQTQAVGGPATKADMGDDLLAAEQGDVLDQEPDHALALTLAESRHNRGKSVANEKICSLCRSSRTALSASRRCSYSC